MTRNDAIGQVRITEQTYCRWRKQYGGMGADQVKKLKRLQRKNERLRNAASDLTLDKLILSKGGQGNLLAPPVVEPASIITANISVCQSVEPVVCWVSTGPSER